MCRFFVYWGTESVRLSDWILRSENSLLQQSREDISRRPNADGWGFAYRIDGKIQLIKSEKAAFEDDRYRITAASLRGDLLFAHVRRRSQGPVRQENSHPFVQDDWVFMHNGNIPNFDQYKERLYQKFSAHSSLDTLGTTDSEFLFKHFIYWFRQAPHCDLWCVHRLIRQIIDDLVETTGPAIQNDLALNFMLSDGKFLVGFRRNRSLFYCNTDKTLLVASEKINPQLEWIEVPENHFLLADHPGQVHIKRYVYGQTT